MATVTPVTKSRSANAVAFAAASVGGDEFANTGKELLLVRHTNSGGAAVTLTIASQAAPDGLAVADKTVDIDPGEDHVLGPWPTSIYNDADGNVQLTWSAVTDIEIAVVNAD